MIDLRMLSSLLLFAVLGGILSGPFWMLVGVKRGLKLARKIDGATEGPTMTDPLAVAVAAYKAMSPVDQALHDDEQRRSFVRGQIGRDPGPSVLADEVRRLRAELETLRAREPSEGTHDGSSPQTHGDTDE